MIKPKSPFNSTSTKTKTVVVTRKPSLPIKRNQSIISNYSCLSDRIYDNNYKKTHQQNISMNSKPYEYIVPYKNSTNNATTSRQKQIEKENYKLKEKLKNIPKFKQKIKEEKSMGKSMQHSLTGFQWLLILRRCFYQENKKRSCKFVKQRTLINYVSNKMYPDTIWNSILMHDNQSKFTNSDIVHIIENEGKSKMNLDDIFVCLSKIFKTTVLQENQSAAQTARFIEQMKTEQHIAQNIPKQQKKLKKSPALITPIAMDPLDMNQFPVESNNLNCQSISPISIINQTNNISFSIQDSSQNSNYYSNSNINLNQRFEGAFNTMQNFYRDLKANNESTSNISAEKKSLLSFIQQILAYSLYKSRNNSPYGCNGFFYGLKIGKGQKREQLYVNVNSFNYRNYREILKKIFSSHNFQEYFKLFSAIKVTNKQEQLPFIINTLSCQNIRILNISSNNIMSLATFRDFFANSNIELLNLNNNNIKNISDLLSMSGLEQLYLKNNQVDHVIADREKVLAHQLKIIDLGCNLIQRQEDLWALNFLESLKMLNLYGNTLFNANGKQKKIGSMLNKQILTNYPQLYIFSAYTQYKDIAFQSKHRNRISTTSSNTNLSTSRSLRKFSRPSNN